jgi:hypothetical protein
MTRHTSCLLATTLYACAPGSEANTLPTSRAAPPPLCTQGHVAWVQGTPGGYPTVEDAVLSTGPGGTVLICPGVHPVSMYLGNEANLTLRGVTGNPADVVLDGQGSGAVIYGFGFDPIARLALRDLTVRGGRDLANDFGGVNVAGNVFNRSNLITDTRFYADNCIFEENGASTGGAVFLDSIQGGWVRNCVFRNNSLPGSYQGSAMTVKMSLDSDTFVISDSTFTQNNSFSPLMLQTNHGTFLPYDARVRLERLQFLNDAGGLLVDPGAVDGYFDVQIVDSVFAGNAGPDVGAISIDGSANTITRVNISGTQITDNTGDYIASAILAYSSSTPDPSIFVQIRDSTIARNVVLSEVGAAPPYQGAAIYMSQSTGLRLRNVDFGTGADANVPADMKNCSAPLGAGYTGQLLRLLNVVTPQCPAP